MAPTMTSTGQAHRGGCGLAGRDNMNVTSHTAKTPRP